MTREENEARDAAWFSGSEDWTLGRPQAQPHEFTRPEFYSAYLLGWSHAADDHDEIGLNGPCEFFRAPYEVN